MRDEATTPYFVQSSMGLQCSPESVELGQAAAIQKVGGDGLCQMDYRQSQVVEREREQLFLQQVEIKQALSLDQTNTERQSETDRNTIQ